MWRRESHVGAVPWATGIGCFKKVVVSSPSGQKHRESIGERENRGDLKALSKTAGTSVGWPTRFSFYQYMKAETDQFRILGLAVKYLTQDKRNLYGQHLVVKCSILDQMNAVSQQVLIDFGASEFTFITEKFVQQKHFSLVKWTIPCSWEAIDERSIKSGTIMYITWIGISKNNHSKVLSVFVTKLWHYSLIWGIRWQRYLIVIPSIDWDSIFFKLSLMSEVIYWKRETV